jgi:N-acetylmuramoyl-L-alanine amidase
MVLLICPGVQATEHLAHASIRGCGTVAVKDEPRTEVVVEIGRPACGRARHVITFALQHVVPGGAAATFRGPKGWECTFGVFPQPATSPAPASVAALPTVTVQAPVTVPPALPLIAPYIVWDPIPFGPLRKAQMVAYVRRHDGSFMKPTYKLIDPHVIVIHYTVTPTFQATYNTFAPDTPDPELHELPNTCAHFVIDKSGVIHQLVSLNIMCRHTVGLNWTAIGIEHVGFSDQEILENPRQIASSLQLVHWLRCHYHIAVRNVIGHNESLSSPYHHEDVPSLRAQTHEDFKHADMQIYRRRLGAMGACPIT